ncbi:MAG TPA: hypothetical protein VKU19_40155 [Bryobacteraceae bacterium]|nr:hypothetical protein [Bryobacteraceae bacterium]
MQLRFCLSAVLLCLPALAKSPLEPVLVNNTSTVEFASGGTIRILNATGQLDVEGWDQPQVEITVIKSTYRGASAKEQENGKHELDRLKVTTDRKSPSELVISTAYPGRSLTRPFRGMTDMTLQYHIKVPNDAHLVIRHDSGDVRLDNLTGEIDAESHSGDMVALLPSAGHYEIDARCSVGGVYSDFAGTHHTRHLIGETFVQEASTPVTKVKLRVGIGGIQVLKITPAAVVPHS